MKNKLKEIIKKNRKVHSIINSILQFPTKGPNYILGIFFRVFPIKKDKIVICNYFGKGYGDNGKYIAEEIIKKGYDYDIVWLLKKDLMDNNKIPKQIRVVEYGSIKGLYELVTAKVWIDNSRKEFYPPKRKNQIYIQTWHGGIPLKQIEKDAEEDLSLTYVNNAKNDSKMADILVSNSEFCTNMYKKSFWYDNTILECGSPRCDILVNKPKNIEQKVRKYFNIEENKKIIIYAPTFRKGYNMEVYNLDFEETLKVLKNKFGGEWVFLIRLHPNISSKSNFINYNSSVINATHYDDMYELLAVSDILITDYSSTMFEFSITNKPVLLYATDIKDYIADRNFYFDIYSLPYKVSENNKELLSSIESFDINEYLQNLNEFYSGIGMLEEGKAATKLVEVIKEFI